MKNNRRNFLKLAGMAGAGMIVETAQSQDIKPFHKTGDQTFNMHGFGAPRVDLVRIGFIGVATRGSGQQVTGDLSIAFATDFH